MNDAISRSAALENLYELDISDCTEVGDVIDKAYATVADAPALDVAPVVHVRWIYRDEVDADNNHEANCSHCGAGDAHREDLLNKVPFCWKCGARMDGGTE